jgi:hypothetical protein
VGSLGKNVNFFRGFDLAELKGEIFVVFELVWLLVEAIVEGWRARAANNLSDLLGCGEVTELAAIFEAEIGRKLLSGKLFEELCTLRSCFGELILTRM